MLDKQGEKWQVFIRRGSWWKQTWLVSPWHREEGLSRPLQALLSTCISPVISNGLTSFPGWDQQPPGGFPENSHHLCAGTKLPSGIGQSEPSPRGKRKRDLLFFGKNAVCSRSSSSWAGHTTSGLLQLLTEIKVTVSLEAKNPNHNKKQKEKKNSCQFFFWLQSREKQILRQGHPSEAFSS